jgi:non-specific serine/threonine protein kinase
LVTLTGVGGVGKSRLALRVARDVKRAFADGVWLVELGALHDPVLLPRTVASALGIADQPARDQLEILTSYLADRQLLLVVDNCEHLVPECVPLVTALLQAARGLRVLATSRVALRIPGEQIYAVTPLGTPSRGEDVPPSRAADYPALALFVDRAGGSRPGFAVNADNLGAVAQVCRRLDGLPLAIELAAARLRSLSVEQLSTRLEDRFRLLTDGGLGVPPRQRTLLAAMEWSYHLCSKDEQAVWARASVFAGRFDLAAAERVCAGDGLVESDVFEALSGLVDKSIVLAEENGDGLRYRMLDTVLAFGLTVLRDRTGEPPHVLDEVELRRRHRDFYLERAEAFDAEWFGPRQVPWSQQLHTDQPELRAALQYSVASGDQSLTALRFAAALHFFWLCCGEVREGRLWLERALAADASPGPERAWALAIYARLVMTQGFVPEAAEPTRECLELAREYGDAWLLVNGLMVRGLYLVFIDDTAAGLALLDEALERAAELRDNPLAKAFATMYRALAAVYQGDAVRAGELFAEGRAISRVHGDQWMLGYCLINAVPPALMLGDLAGAITLVREAVPLHRALHDTLSLTLALEYLAWAAAAGGDHLRAARLLGAAGRQFRARGGSPLSGGGYLRAHQDCTDKARAGLGDAQFERELQSGGELTLEAALAYALQSRTDSADQAAAHVPPAPDKHSELTPRQLQIATLVAQGLSNKQIADQLVISQRTAETHVENILLKLGFTSRAQIAVWYATRRNAD